MKILIIGYGVVGKNMHKIFPNADIYDPFQPEYSKRREDVHYDIGFVCVPTDMLEDGSCDTSIVCRSIIENQEHTDVICVKSTVPPGTTDRFGKCVFSPEYFGGTQHANGADYEFVILGGERKYTSIVALAYKNVMTGNYRIIQTDAKTAELCKYMENSYLAAKVSFCCEFYRISKAFGVDYNELRELFLMDPRVSRSHTFVYEDHPYYDSHCLNKDVPGIINASLEAGYRPDLLIGIRRLNEITKQRCR